MSSSILISEMNVEKVKKFDIETLSEYNHVELESLTTLDFQMVSDSFDILWSEGEPIIFNEEEGTALFKLKPEGLVGFLNNANELSESQEEDKRKIAAFVNQYGYENIYEYATF